jgi:hypothetical protein
MKKITYNVGVLTMSILVSYSLPAYAKGGIPNDKAREGMHFDLGAQGNVEFSSVKYNDNSLNNYDAAKPRLFSDMPLKSRKTHITPSIFAGMRYYLPRNMFWGFHVGDTPFYKRLDKNYRSPEVLKEALYEIHAKLSRINSLYGKLSFGYFITAKTDININALVSWDIYKLEYTRDGYNVDGGNIWVHEGHQTNNDAFSWWGYGLGLGVDRYFSDHIIAALNYAFVMHNSKNKTFDSFTGSGGTLTTISPAPIRLKNMHEHIISVALMYEI